MELFATSAASGAASLRRLIAVQAGRDTGSCHRCA
jgi:hypothetical protein